MTSVEQALLLRLGLSVLHEHDLLQVDLSIGKIGPALVDACAEVAELLAIWKALRFSPSGAMLLYPSDEGYEPGAGPCPACREPGEGALCECWATVPRGEPIRHLTRTGAVLLPTLAAGGGSACSRSRCPQYLVQEAIPGMDCSRAVCAMTGTMPGRFCAPRALDIVEQLHDRERQRHAE